MQAWAGPRPTTTADDRIAAASSARSRPGHPVAGISQERIQRRAVLGGLINEYEQVAQKPRSGPVAEFQNPRPCPRQLPPGWMGFSAGTTSRAPSRLLGEKVGNIETDDRTALIVVLYVIEPICAEVGHEAMFTCRGGHRVSQPDSLQLLRAEAHRQLDSDNYRLAIVTFTRLIAEAQDSSDISMELDGRSGLVAAFLNLGEFESAIDAGTRLLARARQAKDEEYKVEAALWLALTLGKFDLRGRWQEIRTLLLEGLETARAIGDPHIVIYHLTRLGAFAVQMGELDNGLSWLQEALGSMDELSRDEAHWFRGHLYNSLAALMIRRQELLEARRYVEISIGELENCGQLVDIAYASDTLALIHYECGEWTEARHLLGLVLETARASGSAVLEQEAEYLRSKVERELGDLETSLSAGKQSLDLARQMHMKEAEVITLISVGRTLQDARLGS